MSQLYTKYINGEQVIKSADKIVISNDDGMIIHPTPAMLFKDGWKEYKYTAPERTLDDIKKEVISMILEYDSSSDVNEFFMGGIPMWLDKATRAGLMLRFQSEKALGREETTLWFGELSFKLNIDDAFLMLYELESYASACYDKTQEHISNIMKLTDKQSVYDYIYKTGYPEKLRLV